jgi:hypothetical protein
MVESDRLQTLHEVYHYVRVNQIKEKVVDRESQLFFLIILTSKITHS